MESIFRTGNAYKKKRNIDIGINILLIYWENKILIKTIF